MEGSCGCGAVQFTTPANAPLRLFHCHCLDCRKQSASAFGTSAIFPFFTIGDHPHVSHFVRTCDSGRKQKCYFCKECGSRILHAQIVEDGDPHVVAVKGGLLPNLDWKGAVHIYTRSAVVSIPEGVETFEADPGWAKN